MMHTHSEDRGMGMTKIDTNSGARIRAYFQALVDAGWSRPVAMDYCLWVRFADLPADFVLRVLRTKR